MANDLANDLTNGSVSLRRNISCVWILVISALTCGACGNSADGVGGSATGGSHMGGALSTGGSVLGGSIAGNTATGGRAGGAGTGGSSAGGTNGSTAAQFVDAINAVRAAVTQPSNYSGTWTALPNVSWSDSVAASAQAWASSLAATNNCGLQHESQHTYGENLAAGTNLGAKQSVDLWAGEKDLYTWSPTYSTADFNTGSGHYTQLVWRKSTQVGCGSATCGKAVVISCRFLPPGNYIGQAVY
jgi:uncharacterized protein YkwD